MHFGIQNIIFIIILAAAIFFFSKSFKRIWRNIKLGKDINRSDRKGERWSLMALVALGQSKMARRRVIPGFFHIVIYLGFVLINISRLLDICIHVCHKFYKECMFMFLALAVL